jgi:hypothetical protein
MIDKLITIYTPANWREQDAKTLAAALSEPVAMTPMTLVQFLGAVVQAGGNPVELGKLWAFDRYTDRADAALNAGDLHGMGGLIATMPVVLDAGTMAAIGAVVAGMTVNAGGRQAPWTVEEVTAALTQAGHTWTGKEWAHN